MNTLLSPEAHEENHPDEPRVRRWGSLPLSLCHRGSPGDILRKIPSFRFARSGEFGIAANKNMALVIKEPVDGVESLPTPVGLVSPTYQLVQHTDVLRAALNFATTVGQTDVTSMEVRMTPNGERLFMKLNLDKKFSHCADGQAVALQLLCKNSVDGTTALRASLGWFRLVCSNGMTVGVTLKKIRIAHKAGSDPLNAFDQLSDQLESINRESQEFERWTKMRVKPEPLCKWVDSIVSQMWGPLAASRVWHICSSGRDAVFSPPFRHVPASARSVQLLDPVPGAEPGADNVYAVAQALSWVASHRSDLVESDLMLREIPVMISPLVHSTS